MIIIINVTMVAFISIIVLIFPLNEKSGKGCLDLTTALVNMPHQCSTVTIKKCSVRNYIYQYK